MKFFEHLSMKKDPFNQIIRTLTQKGVFVDLLEKYLGMSHLIWTIYEILMK